MDTWDYVENGANLAKSNIDTSFCMYCVEIQTGPIDINYWMKQYFFNWIGVVIS